MNDHAEGKVIFFCGAGVSLDAGYPLFRGLVEELHKRSPIAAPLEFQDAMRDQNYEFALSIIQRKLGTNALKLRRDTAKILSVRPKTLKNHLSILRLSYLRDDSCRLVTTNFDRLFIQAARKFRKIKVDSAPKLPIPKADRWDSVVHLHGLLPSQPDDLELGNLILTSADFGEAYLTDSYCSRFVVELLRNFTVVFIGYSLNDRIMRYLLDAISYSEKFYENADVDGHFNKPYAFVEHNENDKEDVFRQWDLKEVTPIPYFVEGALRGNHGSHFRLYNTIDAWAELAAGGQNARVTLALNEATKPFLAEDTFGQERLLWALRDETGKAAEALAKVEAREQTASIDWLPFFAKNGLLDQVYSPSEFQALLAQRQGDIKPTREQKYLGSVTSGNTSYHLKPVTANLLRWMQWHLDTVELADWFLTNGAVPHPEFSVEYCRPHKRSKRDLLEDDKRRMWDILTSDAYARSQLTASYWFNFRGNIDLKNPLLAAEFLAHVAPKLSIQPSIYRKIEGHSETYFGQFEFELKLRNGQMVHQILEAVDDPEMFQGIEKLCEELSQSLKTGLDWLSLVGKASNEQDLSGFLVPSISPHPQNKFVDDFGALVFLVRTAFDRLLIADAESANRVATAWAHQSYPLFKRLFLYAANRCGSTQDDRALDLLLAEGARWLWAPDTVHEVHVYLRERVRGWKASQLSRLCRAILSGPGRDQYHSMTNREWSDFKDRVIIRYFSKLEQGQVALPKAVASKLLILKQLFPYAPATDDSDEFLIYSGPARDIEWDDGIDAGALSDFLQMSAAERLEKWKPEHSRLLQRLAVDDPGLMLETLEEALTKNLADEDFWSEGISGLVRAFEKNAEQSGSEATLDD
ncbi:MULTISPECIES: SIR2 family protein [Rhizobium/Agrobacterium group]|nr:MULTISPECIES: SIR2 family protein [Rhizobium/Agrobacterium group]OHZ36183.1 hypothetical protein BBL07_16950 [Agrobacterium vitis]